MCGSIVGVDGQVLTVISTFSDIGTRDILDVFGLEDKYSPVLMTYCDDVIDNPEEIISYLIGNYLLSG